MTCGYCRFFASDRLLFHYAFQVRVAMLPQHGLEDFHAGITPYSEAGDHSACRLTLEPQTWTHPGLTPVLDLCPN